ncbi:hypothetical protein ACH5RR_009527 [Cinchona calisaya]|uniref:Leucine-rich repeat-containing N-terminal plant-type domain-containing protein n=1 Tax=Cinchona calisaya TaxID=153742 RepID=A0ABD3AHS3_9GENT
MKQTSMEIKLIWLYTLIQFLILQYEVAFSSSAHHLCHQDDGRALLQFKELFNFNINASKLFCDYSYPKTKSWIEKTDCCTWDGVTCNEVTGHVIGLDLSCSQLVGAISPNSSLFSLSQLQKLNLAFNDFTDSKISSEFGGLTELTHLNLTVSNFEGQIASEISHLSKLVLLDLTPSVSLNFAQHDFHMLLNNLTQISVLCLPHVNISLSNFPMNLSSSLTYLDLSGTNIHGMLPNDVFQRPKMRVLALGANSYLTGSLPKFNCSNKSPLLQQLDLSLTNFTGEIPESIGCLKSINFLNFLSCQLSGHLPSNLSKLVQLKALDLSDNKLEGQIQDSFTNLQHLTYLSLSYNHFDGFFPPSIANLTELKWLDLESNSMTGYLPSNASGLQKLIVLFLSNNSFSGTIPSWLFHDPKLGLLSNNSRNTFIGGLMGLVQSISENTIQRKLIDLSNNKLDGPIPKSSISTLQNLVGLDLSSNNLSGIVEPNMFSNLKKLASLVLSNNRFLWRTDNNVSLSFPDLWELGLSSCGLSEFPDFLKNSKDLGFLELSNNNIHQIPSWFNSMPWDSLFYLNLSYNSLSSLAPLRWKSLNILDFQFNQLQGPLPLSICNLQELGILDLSNNKFTGAIPKCFGNFSSELEVLDLKNNGLQGSIEVSFPRKSSLKHLGLSGNFLEGSLPESLANCEQLEVLDVGNNNMNGTFPTWLENLKEIKVLILKSNQFFGPIGIFKAENPFMNLQIFDLSNNKFTGVLPTRILENLRSMMSGNKNETEAFYLGWYSDNAHYQDSMSIAMKGQEIEFTRILTTLNTIDLSSNNFSGKIPEVMGNLIALKLLNLSHNKLSGHIPLTIGNLSSLETLDLSSNQIDGEIPQQLTSLTSLEVLNLSQNRLVGRIPLSPQFTTFSNDSYQGNLGLCGFPLTKNCGETDQVPPLQEEDLDNFLSGFTWKSVIVGYGFGIVLGVAIGALMFLTGKPEQLVRFIEEEIYQCVRFLCWKNQVYRRFRRPKEAVTRTEAQLTIRYQMHMR